MTVNLRYQGYVYLSLLPALLNSFFPFPIFPLPPTSVLLHGRPFTFLLRSSDTLNLPNHSCSSRCISHLSVLSSLSSPYPSPTPTSVNPPSAVPKNGTSSSSPPSPSAPALLLPGPPPSSTMTISPSILTTRTITSARCAHVASSRARANWLMTSRIRVMGMRCFSRMQAQVWSCSGRG